MYTIEQENLIRKEFWQVFLAKSAVFRRKNGKPKSWLLQRTGIKGVHLKFVVTRQVAKVMVEINRKRDDERFALFVKFEQIRKIFEERTGEGLIWDALAEDESKHEVCRIYWELPDVDFATREQWPLIMNFMTEKMTRLEDAFVEYSDFVKYFDTV